MSERYAVYYAPPRGSALEALGEHWLGRDAGGNAVAKRIAPPALSPDGIENLIASPRGYGFHATLKPPFRVAEGCDAGGLAAALEDFAAARSPFVAPPLTLAALGRFIALVPSAPVPELDALAAACVRAFDSFRASPDAAELARRRAAGLTDRQERMLRRWGYPYVFEEFRFHMTLTGPIAEPERRAAVREGLAPLVAAACAEPLPIGEIGLFRQAGAGQPFRLETGFPFRARH